MSNFPMRHVAKEGHTDLFPSYPAPSSSDEQTMLVGSTRRSFQDPWEHQAFYRGAHMKVLVTTTGRYCSALTRIDLHNLGMQRNETSLPQIFHAVNTTDRCAISFIADSQFPTVYHNGDELLPDVVIVSSMNDEHHCRMTGPSRLGTMSLSPADLAVASHVIVGRELVTPTAMQRIKVSDPQMIRLRRVHESACHLAANTPDILSHPEVARAIKEQLVRAMVGCLAEAASGKGNAGSHLRMPVMRRFEQAIADAEGQPLYLTEICAKIGVQERTLRNHCYEYLGISPHRYLWLRRMDRVRKALSLAEPMGTTVTSVANDYGFWELGRFSVAYRKLFGETPSTTLRKSPEDVKGEVQFGAAPSRVPILL
ncbi:MAG TPA: helix-turn-helix domain-containing protein [Acetobacteraceae bacterium]|nr:helix-turn-helix domain-containing protein [Acetobacteraceae bacterium]